MLNKELKTVVKGGQSRGTPMLILSISVNSTSVHLNEMNEVKK